jgi:hypothetical protein
MKKSTNRKKRLAQLTEIEFSSSFDLTIEERDLAHRDFVAYREKILKARSPEEVLRDRLLDLKYTTEAYLRSKAHDRRVE